MDTPLQVKIVELKAKTSCEDLLVFDIREVSDSEGLRDFLDDQTGTLYALTPMTVLESFGCAGSRSLHVHTREDFSLDAGTYRFVFVAGVEVEEVGGWVW